MLLKPFYSGLKNQSFPLDIFPSADSLGLEFPFSGSRSYSPFFFEMPSLKLFFDLFFFARAVIPYYHSLTIPYAIESISIGQAATTCIWPKCVTHGSSTGYKRIREQQERNSLSLDLTTYPQLSSPKEYSTQEILVKATEFISSLLGPPAYF